MKEPTRIPLDPNTPRPNNVEKIPMPSLEQEKQKKKYPEPIQDDVYSHSVEKELHDLIEDSKEYLNKKRRKK
jgi:hypothetical protein